MTAPASHPASRRGGSAAGWSLQRRASGCGDPHHSTLGPTCTGFPHGGVWELRHPPQALAAISAENAGEWTDAGQILAITSPGEDESDETDKVGPRSQQLGAARRGDTEKGPPHEARRGAQRRAQKG